MIEKSKETDIYFMKTFQAYLSENIGSNIYDTGGDQPTPKVLKSIYDKFIQEFVAKFSLPYDTVGEIWLAAYNKGYSIGYNDASRSFRPR